MPGSGIWRSGVSSPASSLTRATAKREPEHEALSVTGLSKRHREIVAMEDISFEVEYNEIVGLLETHKAQFVTTF